MLLKVIGTGFGRTGTNSMREALNILGFGPCHHMMVVNRDEAQKQRWRAVMKGAPADWEWLFEGFASCVDWPSAVFWRELIAAYPEARVLLAYRTPDSWWESFAGTILQFADPERNDPESLGVAVGRRVFGGRPHDRDHAIGVYQANVESVIATVTPERLLVHRLGDGWEPLCRHLDVPVPDQPYPTRNSSAAFQAATKVRLMARVASRSSGLSPRPLS